MPTAPSEDLNIDIEAIRRFLEENQRQYAPPTNDNISFYLWDLYRGIETKNDSRYKKPKATKRNLPEWW
jgi:hypothetical protein